MKLAGQVECKFSLTEGEAVVYRDKSGKVSPLWLYACEEEHNLTVGLMEKVADPLNLEKAYRKVCSNAGKGGVDGMEVKELGKWLRDHFNSLREELLNGQYRPDLVRGVEIPKPQGGYRQLGIPTVRDRLVQQAIHQVLNIRYEKIFSERSYGFRPHRSAHQALKQAGKYVVEGGRYVIDLDLEKFFDEVNHHRLMWLLSSRIGDVRLLGLIHRFLQAGLLKGGLMSHRIKGTPQGGPLSPLLSNIVLDELDKELERRGHSYVRYADDEKIFVKSELSAHRVKQSITSFIEDKLLLKVNNEKSRICRGHELNFLGHSILKDGSLGLSRRSAERMKLKVKQITRRRRGISLSQIISELNKYLQGWLGYFRYAMMSRKVERLDGWIKRKLRCFRLKQCKRVIGIVRWLKQLGVEETLSWRVALSGKSWWRLSNSPALNIGMNNQWFSEQNYYSLYHNYQTLHRKSL
ncbi:MAG: group II intron reverse transcriptase/maturase [Imperialibacter sp.]|uniref:group II intron reverse transcriptase/maturase n=1 Tax=Imperialibacter sp. TaxID=2038411 RepID=UPI0032EEF94F